MTPREKILIVDDRKENLLALRGVLAEVDAEVIEAGNGNDALAATLHHDFALALLDVQMPEMDGYELAALLRGAPRTRRLPIVFMTAAYGEREQVFKGYEAGAVDYLIKPYDARVLLSKVRVFLELHRANTALAEKVAALAASEERYRSLVTTVPDIVYRIDQDGRFTFLNDAVRNLGYRPEELIGTHFSTILLPPDVERASRKSMLPKYTGTTTGIEGAPRLFDERRSGPRRSAGLEVRLVPSQCRQAVAGLVVPVGDEFITVEVNSSGLYSAPCGKEAAVFLGTVGIIRDISARKRAEMQLGQLNQELVDRARQADSASRAKSDFLSMMSHEIRTPLNAVVGLTGLLAESPLDRRQRDYAEKIQLSARTLCALIDDILDFSKIEAGALQLEHAPLSLNGTLRTLSAVVSGGTRGKDIEALFDVAPDIPDALIGDALRLQQVLMNLTSNAVKFTDAGEVVVAVRRVTQAAEKVVLQFSVRDTGIGISPKQQGRIFEVFAQADSSTSRQYGGSGLGLAISARLAELMGGTISVDSVPGQGSEFRFTVPFAVAGEQPPAPGADRLPGLRLLIIDDHPLARELLEHTCAAFDWQATAVDSGAAGLDELRRSAAEGREYDLVLVDWRMPGMDGIEMLRQALAAPDIILPQVVLLAPGYELEAAAVAGDAVVLDGILAKPITPASLFEGVDRAYSGEAIDPAAKPGKLAGRLDGLRLLVAEDNELNQEVLEDILTRAGAEVVIAANGLAAVQAVEVGGARFDAVLMDVQMPVMDGYTATRIIREELGRADLPIFAVTAHTSREDREKSRQAGMAGHLAKPIEVEHLVDVFARDRRIPPARPAASPAADPSAISLAGLDVATALDIFGDHRKYGALLRRFHQRHGSDAGTARRLAGAGDTIGAACLLHDMRGAASFLRAKEVARLAGAAEKALRNGDPEAVPALLDGLQGAMQVLGESIDQLEAVMGEG